MYFDFTRFSPPLMFSSCPRMQPRAPQCVWQWCLPRLLWSLTVSECFIIFHDLESRVWAVLTRFLVAYSLSGFFCCFTHDGVGAVGFGQVKVHTEVKCTSCHTAQGPQYPHDVTVGNVRHFSKVVFVGFLHCRVIFLFSYSVLGKQVTRSSLLWRKRCRQELNSTSCRGKYLLEFCKKDLSLFHNVFNHLYQ